MPRRGGHSHCQENIKALQTAMSQMKDQFHAMSQQVPNTPQSEYVSSNTIKSYNTGSPQLNSMTMENMVRTRNDMPPDPKSKTKKVLYFTDYSRVYFLYCNLCYQLVLVTGFVVVEPAM